MFLNFLVVGMRGIAKMVTCKVEGRYWFLFSLSQDFVYKKILEVN